MATPPGAWHIGVIGGSGLYETAPLDDAQQIDVQSSFGSPSGPITTGTLTGTDGPVRFTFLARHGAGHTLPPSAINYRANVDVLKRCGVTDVLAISAIGSLQEEYAPGDFMAVDQIIDRTMDSTTGRERSFFGAGCVAHVPLADPVCPQLSVMAANAAEAAGATVHRGGTYVAIEGPQFSTRAESHMYRAWGGDVIGMTAMPEARLVREAELPYALLGMITDYDCWRVGEDGAAQDVDIAQILEVMARNGDIARAALAQLAQSLPPQRDPSPTDTILDTAIITAPEARNPQVMARLDAIAKRVTGG
ncbi:phosphorylase family protein [Alteripontixanthobacter maritimus]|nr:S-methyl-5'-thioadenosine phosphorylase [Alteripontixanthobacter maritimus]